MTETLQDGRAPRAEAPAGEARQVRVAWARGSGPASLRSRRNEGPAEGAP